MLVFFYLLDFEFELTLVVDGNTHARRDGLKEYVSCGLLFPFFVR